MHDIDLILTLTGALCVALGLGLLTQRVGLSPIVGYLLSGVAIGPHTPGFMANKGLADQLAELGVVLLMFGVGLQFHVKEVLSVRRVAVPGAFAGIALATAIGAMVTHGFGWSPTAAIVFGLSISVASTVVLTRVLSDNGELHTAAGHVAMGWLVVEDLFTVLVLVLLPAICGKANPAGGLVRAIVLALVKLAALGAFTFLVGDRLIPRFLRYVVRTGSRELFTLSVLVIALGIAVGSAELFGASMALGAFLAGMVVGRSDFALRAASEALPMRDAFAVLFFVSVGMLFDPGFLLERPLLVLATLLVVLLGKPLGAMAMVRLLGYQRRLALATGVALAQIGEFSFIMATLGIGLGVLTRDAMNTLVAASIVTITLNPLLYRLVPHIERRLGVRLDSRLMPPERKSHLQHRAIVVGYGPIGQTVSRLLLENGIEPTIIELNVDTVRMLHAEGKRALYGDASRREVLEEAGIRNAIALVLSAPVDVNGSTAISEARELNPNIVVSARCSYLAEVEALQRAGANDAFSGEGEVALAMTSSILRRLGATPEQVDRERDRIHGELLTS
jgi:CPA2 family monovalent cation:H+ antiporter-2